MPPAVRAMCTMSSSMRKVKNPNPPFFPYVAIPFLPYVKRIMFFFQVLERGEAGHPLVAKQWKDM